MSRIESSLEDLADEFRSRHPDYASALLDAGELISLSAEQFVFHAGAPCRNYLVLLKGSVRVVLNSVTGRRVVLYRILPGDSCVLTTSCLLGERQYPAEAVTESEVVALVVKRPEFDRLVVTSAAFRRYVFESFAQRLAGMIERMESIALMPIDQRLAGRLLELGKGAATIEITHQLLADDLGTAREVVSRHLKRLEGAGFLTLGRGHIRIDDPGALARIADT